MKKKLNKLGLCCIILSAVIFLLSYFMFHYLTPTGFTSVWHATAQKPFVTNLFANLGVNFLFAGLFSLLAGKFLFDEK